MPKADSVVFKMVGVKADKLSVPILNEKVNSGNILIDGIGVGDVGNIVLRDRHLLAEDGIFIAVVTLDPKNRRIAAGPEIQSRGFVYVRESEELMQEAKSA